MHAQQRSTAKLVPKNKEDVKKGLDLCAWSHYWLGISDSCVVVKGPSMGRGVASKRVGHVVGAAW
jgi:hypothetical protein